MHASLTSGPIRLVPSKYGAWALGKNMVALLRQDQITADGEINPDTTRFFQNKGVFNSSPPAEFQLTVLTTTECNLGCNYCFQNVMLNENNAFNPLRIAKASISHETIESIIKFVRKKMDLASIDRSQLVIFGGEPLLNPEGCISILKAGKLINCDSAGMITNGVLLKPGIAQSLYTAGLRFIQITLDGSSNYHDKIRVNHAGRGTFNTILENSKYVIENDLFSINFRVNVTNENLDSLLDLIDEVVQQVVPTKCSMSFSWTGDVGIGFNNDALDTETIVTKMTDARIKALESGFRFQIPRAKSCGICGVKDTSYAAVVNANGSLFSCWESAGQKGLDIGTVTDGFFAGEIVSERWKRCGEEFHNKEDIITLMDKLDGQFLDYLKDYHTVLEI